MAHNIKSKIIYFILPVIILFSSCASLIPRNKLDNYNNRIEDNLSVYIYTFDLTYNVGVENTNNSKWIACLKEELEKEFNSFNVNVDIKVIHPSIGTEPEKEYTENENNLILSIRQESLENFINYLSFSLVVTLKDNSINKEVWKAKVRSGIKKGSLSYAKSTSGYIIKALKKDGLL
ncbi:hypothetical protein CLV62_12472 [Dysgonomonas alginatilytica]|uniref:Lipoprotein n=1 Tax=Dysgonomonas alginatilytica TaxID=1605892 RepID=A0A2V3PMJ6_9BACT|nr:hypothetical protein [Dysgonomonas alginatilytica]PXV61917.1 hypothetical protein CLV62_12472 [Dysgonomonas alginatilytica]